MKDQQTVGLYSVSVTKTDGMPAHYFVLALSCGGAETAVWDSVYQAKSALATKSDKPKSYYDLISRGAATVAIESYIKD